MPREQLEFLHQMQDTLDNLEYYYQRQEYQRARRLQMSGIRELIRLGNFPPTITSSQGIWTNAYNYVGGRVYTGRPAEFINSIFPRQIVDRISNWDSFELNTIHEQREYTSDLCNTWLINQATNGWSVITYTCIGCNYNYVIEGERVEDNGN